MRFAIAALFPIILVLSCQAEPPPAPPINPEPGPSIGRVTEFRQKPKGDTLDLVAPNGSPSWCAPELCATCGLDPTFYSIDCPDMLTWCQTPNVCPKGMEPLFCAGEPIYGSCVFVGLSVCGESNSTWCCYMDGSLLGSEWSCKDDSDCPPARECLVSACYFNQCLFELAPDGTPCGDGTQQCLIGVCMP